MVRDLSMPLFIKVVIAIVLGVLFGQFLQGMVGSPAGYVLLYVLNIAVTISDLFGRYISFLVPILIIGLVTPAILDFGRKASGILLFTTGISYCSVLLVSLLAWFTGDYMISSILKPAVITAAQSIEVDSFLPKSFVFNPLMGVVSAIALAFSIGLAAAVVKTDILSDLFSDARKLILKILSDFILPLLPYHIGITFARHSAHGIFGYDLIKFANILMVILSLQLLYIFVLYLLSGLLTGKNPLRLLGRIFPVYITALGTQSSVAAIPVSLQCAQNIGVEAEVRNFVIPLCASLHLTGSAVTQVFGAMAVYYIHEGALPAFNTIFPMIIFLGIVLIAASGISEGSPAATLPLLKSFLGFTPDMSAMMYTLALTGNAFSSATNAAGDGAIALIVNNRYRVE